MLACFKLTDEGKHSNALPSEDVCGRNDICRWALCPWTQQLYAPSDDCQYLEGCHCPTLCQRTIAQRPRGGINIFMFRCM
ncbi:hypothetical protein ACOMHN_005811 [Nucella lapillus]